MSRVLNRGDGALLIELARNAINSVFDNSDFMISEELRLKFSSNYGVFVTLHKHGKLRGCIGYPVSSMPLYEALVSAAKSAAFQDPRFVPLSKDEFAKVDIEVSVLTEPSRIEAQDPEDIIKNVKVGRDGLIIRNDGFSGLLLPQVASEYGWAAEEFLRHTCNKAGLHEEAWYEPESRLYTFQAQVFNED